ncbi:MAG: D-amino acid dehydrogenase [Alphaproteobacteria bacterium]
MKAVVLGAGVVGVTTAYYLAREGARVVVVDRQAEAASETSYANAGLISVGHALTWASPRAPRILLRSLWRKDLGFRMHLRADPQLWRWGVRFLRHCTSDAALETSATKYRICRYSQRCLTALREETGIAYRRLDNGLLYFFRDERQFDEGVRAMDVIREQGHELQVVDADGCARIEPTLASIRDELAGGVYCPTDESGDCRMFTRRLAAICRRMGVEFMTSTTVERLVRVQDRIERVETRNGAIGGDSYVLALGSYSPLVARTAGLGLPIYPVKGYSLTLPITNPDAAPRVGGIDEARLVAFGPMGDHLRLTATAEFAGYDTDCRTPEFDRMTRLAAQLFPNGVDITKPEHWACLRPMTPDGPPILGRGPIGNLFLNTGHGSMGWTMACGSSRAVADVMVGREPAVDLAGMTLARFG